MKHEELTAAELQELCRLVAISYTRTGRTAPTYKELERQLAEAYEAFAEAQVVTEQVLFN